jgi:alpha-tubulin suppressor-like RCC1 family protein
VRRIFRATPLRPVALLLVVVTSTRCRDAQGPAPEPRVARIAFDTVPEKVAAGAAFSPRVVVALLDSAGHVVLNATDRVSLSLVAHDSAHPLLGTTSVNPWLGRARFADLRVERAGTGYVLVAASSGNFLARSDSFTVYAAPRAGIRFVAVPPYLETMSPFPVAPEAQLVDAFGNAVTDTAADGLSQLILMGDPEAIIESGVTSRGRIVFTRPFPACSLRTDYRLKVTGPDLAYDASGPLTAFPGQPVRMTVQPGWTPPADPGRPFSLSLELRDNCDHIATHRDSIPVSLGSAAYPPDVVVEGPDTVLAMAGIARFADLRLDRSGWISFTGWSLRVQYGVSTDYVLVVLRNTALAAGRASSCLLHPTGRVLCWGDNSEGQLGDGTVGGARGVPGLAVGSFGTQFLAMGAAHACAVDAAGPLVCWGANDAGQGGRAGASSGMPAPVAGPVTGVQGLAAGERHTCAITSGGTYCWGDNASGQLGGGTAGGSTSTPVLVRGSHAFRELAGGGAHTCALDAAGSAWCWGSNARGQLGVGVIGGARDTAVAVSGGLTFTAITAGANHTCAIGLDGYAYCWGANDLGQLGTNAPAGDSGSPVATLLFNPAASTIAAGADHTCAVSGTGVNWVDCWGDGSYGQTLHWSLKADRLAGGARHTCADTDVGPRCFGDNRAGQLGAGTVGPLPPDPGVYGVLAPLRWDAPGGTVSALRLGRRPGQTSRVSAYPSAAVLRPGRARSRTSP